ncbi:MAG: hypothetical protein J3R72DRAFT_76176 [Linnemannia gamsii]|nr:MAG: hypothetical protein J3R72DRAFT_76176 [Linnemannia gamsii]
MTMLRPMSVALAERNPMAMTHASFARVEKAIDWGLFQALANKLDQLFIILTSVSPKPPPMNKILLYYNPLEDRQYERDEEEERMNDDEEREQHPENINSNVDDHDSQDDFGAIDDVNEDEENALWNVRARTQLRDLQAGPDIYSALLPGSPVGAAAQRAECRRAEKRPLRGYDVAEEQGELQAYNASVISNIDTEPQQRKRRTTMRAAATAYIPEETSSPTFM